MHKNSNLTLCSKLLVVNSTYCVLNTGKKYTLYKILLTKFSCALLKKQIKQVLLSRKKKFLDVVTFSPNLFKKLKLFIYSSHIFFKKYETFQVLQHTFFHYRKRFFNIKLFKLRLKPMFLILYSKQKSFFLIARVVTKFSISSPYFFRQKKTFFLFSLLYLQKKNASV